MNLQDALFNWLQMEIVVRHRPDDRAAIDTHEFFLTILKEDHRVEIVDIAMEEDMYVVTIRHDGEEKVHKFYREGIEQLWQDIESNPKYNE